MYVNPEKRSIFRPKLPRFRPGRLLRICRDMAEDKTVVLRAIAEINEKLPRKAEGGM
jgi:hypothetical protein